MLERKTSFAGPAEVLIVDAHESSQKSLSRAIRRAGFKTEAARNEAEAVFKMMRHHFPLVVIDLWQASRSAVNVVQQVRRENPTSKIVVITPYEAKKFCTELKGLDVFECLRKPVKRSVLVDAVRRGLLDERSQVSE
jgi:DNA-binding NtrC family response regulator